MAADEAAAQRVCMDVYMFASMYVWMMRVSGRIVKIQMRDWMSVRTGWSGWAWRARSARQSTRHCRPSRGLSLVSRFITAKNTSICRHLTYLETMLILVSGCTARSRTPATGGSYSFLTMLSS
jgi:hypothetical protein